MIAPFAMMLLLWGHVAIAQRYYYSNATGNSSASTSWVWATTDSRAAAATNGNPDSSVPNATNHHVRIGQGHVITVNANATWASLIVNDNATSGVLDYEAANNRTITVVGNVTVNTSGTLTYSGASNRTHVLQIGGDLSVAGTFDLEGATTRIINLVFNGTTDQYITGSGTFDTYNITFNNTGSSGNDRIFNQSANFTTSIGLDRCTFTDGTYVHDVNTAISFVTGTGPLNIPNMSFDVRQNTVTFMSAPTATRTVTIDALTISGSAQVNTGINGANRVNLTTNGNVSLSNSSRLDVTSNLTVGGTLNIANTAIVNVGDGDGTTSNLPTQFTTTINGTGASSITSTNSNGALFTHNLTLGAGANLTISGGASVHIGGDGADADTVAEDGLLAIGSSATLTINGAATTLTLYNQTTLGASATWTINNGTVNAGNNKTNAIDNNPEIIILQGNNSTLNLSGGTLNILLINDDADNNAKGIIFESAANNSVFNMTGGILNLGNTNTAQGVVRFRGSSGVVQTFNISGGTANIYDRFICNDITFSGVIAAVNLSGSASLLVGDGTVKSPRMSQIRDFTITGASYTCRMAGLDILVNGTMNMGAGTLHIAPGITTVNNMRFRTRGQTIITGGTVLIGEDVTDVTAGNLVQIDDDALFDLTNCTVTILGNSGLTDIAAASNPFNVGDNNAVPNDGDIGDGDVKVNSGAILSVCPNLVFQVGTPVTRNVIDIDGRNANFEINGGTVICGGGNRGNFRLNRNNAALFTDTGPSLYMTGGTLNVTAGFRMTPGSRFELDNGTVNIGVTSSNGANTFILNADTGHDKPTYVIINGGTLNIGDGNSSFRIGDGDNNPAYGDADSFGELQINGGNVNLNGGFSLDDGNARFTMTGGTFTINPRYLQSLVEDYPPDIFGLRRGIVDIQTGTIIIQNPNANLGTGYAFFVRESGNPGTGAFVTGPGGGLPNFGTSTVQFGDGVASANGVAGQGFDCYIANNTRLHTLVVNNPTGSNRFVEITNSGASYTMTGNLTITAGALDINNNTINRQTVGGTLTIGNGGKLIIGNNNGANIFPGVSTAFATYDLQVGSTVEYDGTGGTGAIVDIPGTAEFWNLTIKGDGNKTLPNPETVRGTLELTGGTFVASTNLTMDSGSKILRTNTNTSGIMTGTVQGSNDYTIEYTGPSKDTQTPEWSGVGPQTLIVNLNSGQTLTAHTNLSIERDLYINSGIFADAGFTHTVNRDIFNYSTHSGTGKILITAGSTVHYIGGDGNGIFGNVELNDSNGAEFQANQRINGTLTLTSGVLNIGNYLLTFGSAANVSGTFSSSRMIQVGGTLSAAGVTKEYAGTGVFTWPIGVTGKYTPAVIDVNTTGSPGTINIKPINNANPFTTDPLDLELNYYWFVTSTGFTGLIVDHTYTYQQVDQTGRGSEAAYIAGRYHSASWTTIDNVTSVNETSNQIFFTDVGYIEGQYTAGEPSEFGIVLSYYSRQSGDWDDPNTWSNTSHTGSAGSTVPGSSSPVFIGDNDVVIGNIDDMRTGELNIDATGTLEIANGTTGHIFNEVKGQGVFRLISNTTTAPAYPTAVYNGVGGIMTSSGGTIEFSGTGSYTIPSTYTSMHSLKISGSAASTKTMPNANFTLTGNYTVNGTNTSVLLSNGTSGNLSISGDFSVGSGCSVLIQSGNNRTITIGGNVTNAGSFTTQNTGSNVHNISIGGSVTNTGTLDFRNASVANVTFTGSTNASISGTGAATDFNRIIVNKGTSYTPILDVTATNFSLNTALATTTTLPLEIQNGTFRLSIGYSFDLADNTSNTSTDFTIPSTGGLWLNHASAQLSLKSGLNNLQLYLYGYLRVTNGTLIVGDDTFGTAQNAIQYGGTASSPSVMIVEGGLIDVKGYQTLGSIVPVSLSAPVSVIQYTQSGGTLRLATNRGCNVADLGGTNESNADFAINSANSSFTMSGGTIEIVRRNTNLAGKALCIASNPTVNVTGGTIQILNNNTNQNHNVSIYTPNVPLWNLSIGTGNSFSGFVAGPTSNIAWTLIVQNDFILNLVGGSFRAYRNNNSAQGIITMRVGGNFTVTNGTFLPGDSQTTTFNGSGLTGQSSPQVISAASGTVTFDNIEMNNTTGTNTVQIGSSTNLIIRRNWTNTTNCLNPNNRTVTFDNTSSHNISGVNFTYYNLIIQNTTTSAVNTLTVSNVLTLDAVLDIGVNGLVLSNPSAGAVTTSSSFSGSRMISCSGSTSAIGVTRHYPNSTTTGFVFPVGVGTTYSPAQIDLTAAGGTGTVRLFPVNARHPNALTGTGNEVVPWYWRVYASGFSGTQQATHQYTYAGIAVEGGSDATFVGAYYTRDDGTPVYNWITNMTTPPANAAVNPTTDVITFTSPGGTPGNVISGDYTAGKLPAFANPTILYSRKNGNWNDVTPGNATWSTVALGGTSCNCYPGTFTTGSVVVVIGNSNTVTISSTETNAGVNVSQVTLNSDGTLESQSTNPSFIQNVTGSGLLRFNVGATPTVPPLSAAFTSTSGGTVEYRRNGANYNLPTTPATYNNLIITPTTGGTLSAATSYTIRGNLTLSTGGTFNLGTNTLNRETTGGTLTIDNGVTLQLQGLNNFPQNYTTYSLGANSTVDYNRAGQPQTVFALNSTNGGGYGNLTLSSTSGTAVPRNMAGNIIIKGSLTIGTRISFNANNYDINIRGNWTRTATNGSEFVPGTGTVTFDGSASQTITINSADDWEDFHNLTISNNAGVVLNATVGRPSHLQLTGNLTFTGSAFLNMNSSGSVTKHLHVAGNITNNSSSASVVTGGTSTDIILTSTTANQTIGGTASSITLPRDLILQKAAGTVVNMNIDVTVMRDVRMENQGNIVLNGTSDTRLVVGTNGQIRGNAGGTTFNDFDANRMIVTGGATNSSRVVKQRTSSGAFDFTFPIGVGTSYTPFRIQMSSATVSGTATIAVRSVNGNAGIGLRDPERTTNALQRYFITNTTNLSSATGNIRYKYVDADVVGNETQYKSFRKIGTGDWDYATTQYFDAPGNEAGATSNSDLANATVYWIVAENKAVYPTLYSAVDEGNWNTVGTWDTDLTTAGIQPPSGTLWPSLGDRFSVVVRNGFDVVVTTNSRICDELEIQAGAELRLGTTVGHDFDILTGSGVLETGGSLPTVHPTLTTFYSATGGTVRYLSGTYSLPTTTYGANNTYGGLEIVGTGVRVLSANTTITKDLTINTGTLGAGTHNVNLAGSLFLTGGGTYNAGTGTLTLNGTSATQNIPALTLNNLTMTGAANKALSDATTVNNNVLIQTSCGNVSVGGGTGTITVGGNWTNASTNINLFNGSVLFNNTSTTQNLNGATRFNTMTVTKDTQVLEVNSNGNRTTNLQINSGTLDINTFNFRVAGSFVLNGNFAASSGSTMIFNGTGTQEVTGTTPSITFYNLQIDKASGTFNYTSKLVNSSSQPGINQNLLVTDGTFAAPSSLALNVGGDITIGENTTDGVNGTLDATNISTINLAGDWTMLSEAVFTAGTSTVVMSKNNPVITNNSALTFYNLTKNGTGNMTLAGSHGMVRIGGTFTFGANGLINTTTSNLIRFLDGASVAGNNSNRYISGPAEKEGNDDFTFPLGDATRYAPIGISGLTSTSNVFRASYSATQNVNAIPQTIFDYTSNCANCQAGLNRVSTLEYWEMTRPTGTEYPLITLHFPDPAFSYVDMSGDYSKLVVAHWNGTQWESLGNDGSGSLATGTVRASSAPTSLSPLTLGNLSGGSHPLPVTLVSFTGKVADEKVVLEWTTASEYNNAYFDVQRSEDGVTFETIGRVNGKGTSTVRNDYRFIDIQPLIGVNYYRLKQVDTDGKFEYTKVIAVNFTQEDAGSAQVLVYPNPLQKQERLTLEVKGFAPESEVSIQLVDMTGRVMYVATSKTTKSGMLNEELRMPTEIASGVYNLIIRDAEKSYTKRIVVR